MKQLSDGVEVSAKSYYYLLDWNEADQWQTIAKLFNKNTLNQLTIKEYQQLFETATQQENEQLLSKS